HRPPDAILPSAPVAVCRATPYRLRRSRHREHPLDHAVLVITAAGDRPHRSGIDAALAYEALIDVDAHHPAEDEPAPAVAAVHVLQLHHLGDAAFEGGRGGGDARRPYQARR